MSQEIATRTPQQELVASVRSPEFKQQVALALPEGVKPERFQRVVVTALLDNPDLAGADPNSVFNAALHAAKDGLLPDGREAAFVMFRDKATYMPMIGGFRKIAAEFGWAMRTRVVYENDTFDHELGADETIRHHPARPGIERGQLVAAYAVAKHRDGRTEIEVVYGEDVAKARKVSRASDRGPWVEWPERMWEKTAGRRLFAKLPLAEADRERRDSLLAADEIPPGRAAEALYGPEPHTAQAPRPPGEDGTEQAAEEVVAEAERETGTDPSGSPSGTDGASAPAPADDEPEVVEGEVVDEEGGQFAPPEGVDANHPDVVAANEAAELGPTSGKYKGKNLREIADDGDDGASYVKWICRNWKTEPLKSGAIAFAKVYLPQVYAEIEEQETGE